MKMRPSQMKKQRLPLLKRLLLIATFLFGDGVAIYVWLVITPARVYSGALSRRLGCVLFGSTIPLIAEFDEESVHDASGNDLYGIRIVT